MKPILGRIITVSMALLAVSLLVSCSPGAAKGEAALGEEFTIAAGKTVEIEGVDLSIKFEKVTSDSRCPTGAQCIQAGQAACQVKTVDKGTASTVDLVATGGTGGYTSKEIGQYRFDFQVLPYPRVGETIKQSDYTLKMVINKATTSQVPPLNPGNKGVIVDISNNDLTGQKTITKTVEVTNPGSLILNLPSNPSTGYSWSENATITDKAVVSQYEHNYVAPPASNPPVVGASGKEVWTFKTLKPGTCKITVQYARPWEPGNAAYTVTIDVTVK